MTVVKQKPNLTREELKIIKTLKEDSSIAVVPADKGNTTVFANSANYKEKKQHLCYTPSYLLIKPNTSDESNNHNSALMRKTLVLLKDLKKESRITEEQYKHMYAKSPTNPLFYATSKFIGIIFRYDL